MYKLRPSTLLFRLEPHLIMLRRLDENALSHAHKNEENELQNVKNDNIREIKANAPTKSPARRPINTGLRDRENRQTPTSKSRVLDVQRATLTPTKCKCTSCGNEYSTIRTQSISHRHEKTICL